MVKIRPSIGFPSTYLGMYDSPFTRFVQKNEPNRLKVSSIRFDPFILKVEFVLYIFCFNVPQYIYIDGIMQLSTDFTVDSQIQEGDAFYQ